MAQRVIVVDYDPAWPRAFCEEAARIRAILAENCVAIHHIGSTAVPGLAAKPIIDIMPVVRSLERVDLARAAFEDLGYEYMGEFGIPGRRYMRKGGDKRTHQVHIFCQTDVQNIRRHLAFRDHLRSCAEDKAAYAALKRALAARFPRDIEGYCDAKAAFVRAIEEKALADAGRA